MKFKLKKNSSNLLDRRKKSFNSKNENLSDSP